MPIKGSGEATLREVDRFADGVGWQAYPDEAMARTSHALATDAGVWAVDPLDAPGLDDLLAEFGAVTGVVCCLARHTRDSAAIARRHDVPVYLPGWMTGVASGLDAPVERFGRELPGTDYAAIRVRDGSVPPWQEVALFDGETLYVPEAVGTGAFFRGGDERLGVHAMLRLTPPRRPLGGLDPDRVLVGHGEGIESDAAGALRTALAGARRTAPSLYARALRSVVG